MTRLLPNSENLVKKSSHFDEKGRPKSEYMAGQAVPKSESGIPKPIKAIYIIINNTVAIECTPAACKKIMFFEL